MKYLKLYENFNFKTVTEISSAVDKILYKIDSASSEEHKIEIYDYNLDFFEYLDDLGVDVSNIIDNIDKVYVDRILYNNKRKDNNNLIKEEIEHLLHGMKNDPDEITTLIDSKRFNL